MLPAPDTRTLLAAAIVITGGITSLTDFRERKIFNGHLALFFLGGALLLAQAALNTGYHIAPHLLNGTAGLLIGILLFRHGLFRGGDSKLLALLCLLMPPTGNSRFAGLTTLELLAASFITGLALLSPFLLADIVRNARELRAHILSPYTQRGFLKGLLGTVALTWVLLPLTKLLFPDHYRAVSLCLLYLLQNHQYAPVTHLKRHRFLHHARRNIPAILGIAITGFLLRLWLMPGSLLPGALAVYALTVAAYAAIFILVHTVTAQLRHYQDRIPFAPILFAGCLACYTPLLNAVMVMTRR